MTLGNARTLLFVPGDRPDRFDKAASAGADVVILDLEDAVAAAQKDEARRQVVSYLRAGGVASVRINSFDTAWHAADLDAIARASAGGVVVPKAEDPAVVAGIADRCGMPVLAIIETARGVLAAPRIAAAPGVTRLALGALDLAADIGTGDAGVLAQIRTQVVLASRAAGLAGPVDSVTTDVRDAAAAAADARAAKRVGMAGKLCVHPRQVGPVALEFGPTDDEVRWARAVLAAVGENSGVVVVSGEMVDEPVLKRARRIVSDAEGL